MDPIHEWLDIDIDRPNHYQLLRIPDFESDPETIAAAADRAMSRVRSRRPGQYAKIWMQLLDRLADAKRCLTDPGLKEDYDRALRSGEIDCEPLLPADLPTPNDDGQVSPAIVESLEAPAGALLDSKVPPPALEPLNSNADDLPGSVAGPNANLGPSPGHPVPVSQQPASTLPSDSLVGEGDWDQEAILPAAADSTTQTVSLADDSPHDRFSPTEFSLSIDQRGPSRGKGALLPIVAGVCAGLLILAVYGAARYSSASKQPTEPTPTTVGRTDDQNSVRPAESSTQVGTSRETVASQPQPDRRTVTEPNRPDPFKNELDVTANPTLENVSTAEDHLVKGPDTETAASRSSANGEPKELGEQLTSAERQAFRQALNRARTALATRDFTAAEERLAAIRNERIRNDDDRSMVDRLQQVGSLVKEFHAAVDRAVAKLDSGAEIKISATTVVAVVEVGQDSLILQVRGRNRSYELNALSPGLAMALAEMELGKENPRLRLLKGAYLAIRDATTETQRERARTWLNEVSGDFPEASEVLGVLDDNYQIVGGR